MTPTNHPRTNLCPPPQHHNTMRAAASHKRCGSNIKERATITADHGRIPSAEGNTPPPGGFLSWDDYMAAVEQTNDLTSSDRFALTAADADAIRRADYDANTDISEAITKAMRLAANTITFRALLEGQEVPVSALDPVWAHRYGLRKAA